MKRLLLCRFVNDFATDHRDPELRSQIFENPESGADQTVQFAPQREYHDEYLYS